MNIQYNFLKDYLLFKVFYRSIYKSINTQIFFFFHLADEERTTSPTKMSRTTTPRRVQIVKKPSDDYEDEVIASETESISTAIDVEGADDDDIPFNEYISESPVDNMFANLVINGEPLITAADRKKSPRRTSPIVTTTTTTKKTTSTPSKFHHTRRTVSEISDEESIKIEEIPEEISIVNYSEDFSPVPTESSTPRSPTPTNVRYEKQPQ